MSLNTQISSHEQSPQIAAASAVLINADYLQGGINKESLLHLPVQRKLTIGSPNDPLEHEADAVADKVMRMPEPRFIQRKCAECEEEEMLQQKPLASSITPFIQAKGNDSETASDAISQRISSTRSSGSSMDSNTQNFMESRFGKDFSNVKIHTGDYAAQLSEELNAQAFTVGNDIYFNSGRYDTGSYSGKHLLAHELTHTVQQTNEFVRKIQRFTSNCLSMLRREAQLASPLRVITGNAVHLAIQADFAETVSGSRSVGIPGASAAPLRTMGLCGEDTTQIASQIIGGRAGMGYPDLAKTTGTVLEVAEIKPASFRCAIDGEAQLAGYVDQGNASDSPQIAWRAAQGITSVVPMLPSTYPGKTIIIGTYMVQIEWCNSGLLVYQVMGSSLPVPVVVPVPVASPNTVPNPSPARVREHSGWETIRDFAREAIESGETASERIRQFLIANPELIDLVIGVGVLGLIATFGEDIATLGAGLLDDLVTVPFFASMISVAMELRQAIAAGTLVVSIAR
jgi:hypothetical protein